jgi:hypothetical protein
VAIIDLGLPDGSGVDLIGDLARLDDDIRPIILATSGADGEGLADAALAAGADDFLLKPIASVSQFQQAVLKYLPEDRRPSGPRLLSDEVVQPDPLALSEDLSHLDELLKTGDEVLPYVAPFLQGLARLAGDSQLKAVSDQLSAASDQGSGVSDAIAATRGVIADRLSVGHVV